MLDLKENLLLGQIIGLINGLYNDPNVNEIEGPVRFAIEAIKNKENYDEARDMIFAEKKKYLAKCTVCPESCGKADDYFLNSITDKEKRDKKISDFKEFLAKYDEALPFQTVLDEIAILRWW